MSIGGSSASRAVVKGAALAATSVASFAVVVAVFISTPAGQRIDETALRGARIGQSRVIEGALSLLHLVSGVGLVLATLGIAIMAFSRRRWDLAAASVVIVGGSNLTTQALKYLIIDRPNVGIDTYTVNSLPSGHTTVAVSLAASLVLVAPRRLRGPCAVLGAAAATLMGIATLAAGWHRPSDVVAATFVVGAWVGMVDAGLALVLANRGVRLRRAVSPTGATDLIGRSGAVLATVGLALLGLAGIAMWRTSVLTAIPTDRYDLFVGYAGGAAGIGAIVSLVLAAVLALAQSASVTSGTVDTTSEISVSARGSGAYAPGTSTRTQTTRPVA